MIKLTNVTKTYVSKTKKQRVDALKGVDFELGSKGMVFILGKSGSGKSTLLNLLGGLDSPTTGEIVVDGVSMRDFRQADYEGYRNGYVGFIFQEFNLLDEFNVKDNVALALHLSKGDNVDERVLTALKQVELNEDYLTRRVDEMSGGEKQRVAIARTIVKESKMILADEPTGNLDAATGESIWNILKAQSQSKLVVVVSHDRESAEKYGDRVIEIADGKVIADSGAQTIDNGVEKPFATDKKRLPFLTCLRMGVNSLLQRKVRSISVLLLSILSILTLVITELCMYYSEDLMLAGFIQKYDVDYFVVKEEFAPRKGDIAFLDENCSYIKSDSYSCPEGIINSKQDIYDMGWSFVGEALELDNDSYYVTTKHLDDIERKLDDTGYDYSKYYYYLDDNGDEVHLSEKPSSWESLIGKRFCVDWVSMDNLPVLAGIVDVSHANELTRDYLPDILVLEDFTKGSPSSANIYEYDGYVDFGGGKRYSGKTEITTRTIYNEVLITESGLGRLSQDMLDTLGEGEIVLTYEMLAALFDVKSKSDYVTKHSYSEYVLNETPEQIGQTYPFVLYDEYDEVVADFGELKIVGVCISFGEETSTTPRYECVVSRETVSYMRLRLFKRFIVRTSSVSSVKDFISSLGNYSMEVNRVGTVAYLHYNTKKDCVEHTMDFMRDIESFTVIIGSVSIISTLILILLVINLITLSITGRKKEIGILSALGTSNKDIAKIFIFETLVIAVITFVLVLIGSFAFVAVFNNYFSFKVYRIVLEVPFFNVDALTIVTVTAASFGLLVLGTVLPLIKMSRLKPIDAIRNL